MARRLAPVATALVAALVFVPACSNYVGRSSLIRTALIEDDYDRALAAADEIDKSNSELLYLYERGLILHGKGDYAGSSEAFAQSELVLENLYTKSITREAATLAVSETIGQYRGDAFEAVFVNYYQILNYLGMGDVDGALVECRRVNRKLQMLKDGGETYFENDPFMQYLTGIVYDIGGERDDAGVSYRVAAELYDSGEYAPVAPLPPSFFCDAAQNAYQRGDREESSAYAERAHCATGADTGCVSLFLECGQVIRKREASVVLPIFESDRWTDNEKFANEMAARHGMQYDGGVKIKYWLKVALPVLEPMPPRYTGAVVRAHEIDGRHAQETRAVTVSNVDAFAEQAFREKESTMFVRAIVRAIIKYLAQQSADKQDEGFGALVNIFNIVTETADTRSWSTLPHTILLARLDLPAGRYRVEADLLGPDGHSMGTMEFNDVEVRAGAHVIRNAHAY